MERWIWIFALAALVSCHDDDDDIIFIGSSPTDFNRDGLAEVLVGAPLDDAGVAGSDRGRVYLYAGGSGPNATPDMILDGTETGGQFGYSVAAIGDYNGDGYADFAVGAPFEAGGGVARGRVHIFYGGPFFPALPSVTLSGDEDNAHFGWSVARAGDVNGDGRDDLLVGAPDHDATGTNRGRAYLFAFSGGTTPLQTYSGAEDDAAFGFSVDTAGNMNGDAYFDVAVGAPLNDAAGAPGADRGRVFVFFGGAAPDATADYDLQGTVDAGQFGYSVAGLLDWNLDGFGDLAVGAPFDATVAADAGRAFVFFGGPVVDLAADRTMLGSAGARFGQSVARIGDINAAGAPDFLVGAPFHPGGGAARGQAYVFRGGTDSDTTADFTFTGSGDNDHFGSAAFSGGDVDGDGWRDLVVSAPDHDASGPLVDAGRVFFFRGGGVLDTVADGGFDGAPEAGARAGASVQ